MSVDFFFGTEEYLIEQEIIKQKEKFLDKDFALMNFKCLKNLCFSDLISTLQTQPMMFGEQIIVIDVENFFTNFTFEDKQAEEFQNALVNVAPSLHIIFTLFFERNSKKKPDSRKKFFKILEKFANLKEFSNIPVHKKDELVNFINKEAKKNEISFEKAAALRLVEQVGNNLRELAKEVEKLVLVCYPKNKVTENMVKDNCITNEDIFSLTDKLCLNKKASALKEFRKLCDKDYPIKILFTLQTNLRKAIIIKLNEKKLSPFEISKLTGFTDFVVQLRMQALKNANLKDLIRLKRNLANAEFNIKTGKALDVEKEIEIAFYK